MGNVHPPNLSNLSVVGLLRQGASWLDEPEPLKVRVYTHNIRYDNRNPSPGEHLWEERREYVSRSIFFNTNNIPSVVCLQEVLHHQLTGIVEDLNHAQKQASLGHGWTYAGVGRADGKTKGEYSPIVYNTHTWDLVESQTFWLSETPDVPSKGWDADLERVVVWVHLKSKKDPKVHINVFNTHLDHIGVVARRESVKLIIQKAGGLNSYPSIFAGDFNVEKIEEPYVIAAEKMYDAATMVHGINRYGHNNTFTGFDHGQTEPEKVIDYIWIEKEKSKGLKVQSYGVLHSIFHSFYMSDHRPVAVDISISET
ncbi:hypothetical protein BABINDRAFT_35863 [Babjeviella inositovora NRRL Y-12698]|uniref:Endonuclease/exonuclease/phosphatase domain-containing protein n=1 Tax=Babjeviella inositovora NRRL Y-12698 TaxID=984486 RepID=A0A1E3QS96_9ASCO|nr:uncharacterized protein BABINDRAFT_35863 [Babjeviella inositovora NRRL Y-12698]ODQ80374.1 hypothetical protein BABINDRAFT_35863 [Babjeviella inositovora NRRL Y-12698]